MWTYSVTISINGCSAYDVILLGRLHLHDNASMLLFVSSAAELYKALMVRFYSGLLCRTARASWHTSHCAFTQLKMLYCSETSNSSLLHS